MPTSRQPNQIDDLKFIAKVFMHDIVKTTPVSFKNQYLELWNIISKKTSFPLLELTREFILETGWRDLMDLMAIIPGTLNQFINAHKSVQADTLYPLAGNLHCSFNRLSLNFVVHILTSENLNMLNTPTLSLVLASDAHKKLQQSFITIDNSPLMNAIAQSESYTALELIRVGADVNKYSVLFGNNPLLLAVAKGWNHISDEIPEDELPGKENQKMIIEALLNRADLDINAISVTTGMTALHIACLRGDEPTLIELLLQRGAGMHETDCYGLKPMDYLELTIDDAKKFLPAMLNGIAFGTQDYPAHQSTMATLPTATERSRHIILIKKIFERVLHSAAEPAAKRPRY